MAAHFYRLASEANEEFGWGGSPPSGSGGWVDETVGRRKPGKD